MKFRRLPLVIDAERFRPGSGELWPEGVYEYHWPGDKTSGYAIDTLEGMMRVKPQDWIITGIDGERYCCDSSIFRKLYVPADWSTDEGP